MPRNPIIIFAMLLGVLLILNAINPGGIMSYLLPSICWTAVAIATLVLCGTKIRSWTNKRITLMALLISFFQIFIIMDAGLINGFGESPLSHTATAITANLTLVTTTLVGTELSRAYLTKNLNRKRPNLIIGITTALYTIMNVSVFALINVVDPMKYSEFLGTGFLPILSENLLATYLALLSGPAASIAYRGPLQAFQWFVPILPDLSWAYKSLIGVMAPAIGFIFMTQATTQKDLIRAGLPTQRRPAREARKGQTSIRGWLALTISLVLIVWTSTGLLGFYPTTIASGSMRPTMDVGDIAITTSIAPSEIQIGDIVQFWREGEMILHRIVEIQQVGAMRQFITKGDANPISDTDPVQPSQIRGKLVFIVPKLGWVSIYFKTTIANIWTFYSSQPILAYTTTVVIIFAGAFYSIRTYKDRSSKPKLWRRR